MKTSTWLHVLTLGLCLVLGAGYLELRKAPPPPPAALPPAVLPVPGPDLAPLEREVEALRYRLERCEQAPPPAPPAFSALPFPSETSSPQEIAPQAPKPEKASWLREKLGLNEMQEGLLLEAVRAARDRVTADIARLRRHEVDAAAVRFDVGRAWDELDAQAQGIMAWEAFQAWKDRVQTERNMTEARIDFAEKGGGAASLSGGMSP